MSHIIKWSMDIGLLPNPQQAVLIIEMVPRKEQRFVET